MITYDYDKLYSYEKILKKVKELILPTIEEMIHPDELMEFQLSRNAFAEILYTHIMALGYNEGDLRAAFDDIFPTRNPIMYPENEQDAAGKMILNLANIKDGFKHQYWAFQEFHQNTKDLMPHKDVILEVEKQLLATQF